MKKIYSRIMDTLTLMCCCLLSACVDDMFTEYGPVGEGSCRVEFNLTFKPLASTKLTTRSAGDAVTDINHLWILVYERSDAASGSTDADYTLNRALSFSLDNSNDTDSDDFSIDKSEKGGEDGDVICKASFGKVFPYGTYKIIAVANYANYPDGIDLAGGDVATLSALKAKDFPAWEAPSTDGGGNSVFKNRYMSGWFSNSDGSEKTGNDPETVIIDGSRSKIHCWLRRAVAKVTVSYDATDLNDDIYIYLKSVTVKDVPLACHILDKNKPANAADSLYKGAVGDSRIGDRIDYAPGVEDFETGYRQCPYVTAGDPLYPKQDAANAATGDDPHSATAEALFTYENMQGKGNDKTKLQDADYDGVVDSPGKKTGSGDNVTFGFGDDNKDGMECCTYIEVEAYYVSAAPGNEGKGPITYRFALGKNVTDNFDVERNHHYKLTLKFNGYANDIDWHIEYEEQDNPGIFVPDNFFVSYLNNTPDNDLVEKARQNPAGTDAYWEFCYPIRLAGTSVGDSVYVRIVENGWLPVKDDGSEVPKSEFDHFTGPVTTYDGTTGGGATLTSALTRSGVWHGFLSLYRQPGQSVILTHAKGAGAADEYIWWYARGENPKYENALSSIAGEVTGTHTAIAEQDEHDFGEGYRKFTTSVGKDAAGNNLENGTAYYSLGDGDTPYKVVRKTENGEVRVTIYVPLFTRPLLIVRPESWTGNNPYVPYRRKARLQITAKVDGAEKTTTDNQGVVYQVRRIVNPKAILRRHDNVRPFTVTLRHTDNAGIDASMDAVRSDGAWRATLMSGSEGWQFVGSHEGLTGSTVRFTVKPTGTINEDDVRCAIVLVEYHNYRCTHKIALRQGYAPVEMGGKKWHLNNLEYVTAENGTTVGHLTACPLNEGSLFRYGNLTQPIDAINNTYDSRYPNGGKTYAFSANKYLLAPVTAPDISDDLNDAAKFIEWADIIPNTNGFGNPTLQVEGTDGTLHNCHIACLDDYNALGGNDYDYGFGMVYADEATSNALTQFSATHHSWFSKTPLDGIPDVDKAHIYGAGEDAGSTYGMRCCVVYRKSDCRSIIFPLGTSGYGRRKGKLNSENVYNGALRYANRDNAMSEVPGKRPLLYRLYGNYGAIYWLGEKKHDGTGTKAGWDINYSSFDFNAIDDSNIHCSNKDTRDADACFIRLIEDN